MFRLSAICSHHGSSATRDSSAKQKLNGESRGHNTEEKDDENYSHNDSGVSLLLSSILILQGLSSKA